MEVEEAETRRANKRYKQACANYFCTRSDQRLYHVIFMGEPQFFCEECRENVQLKNFCPGCKKICGDVETQPRTWIQCENENCKQWYHTSCERPDIRKKLQKGNSFKYICMDCSNKRMVKKYSSGKESYRPQDQSSLREEIRKIMANRRRPLQNFNYIYTHSEYYQPISKILSNAGCPSIQMSENEINQAMKEFISENGIDPTVLDGEGAIKFDAEEKAAGDKRLINRSKRIKMK